MLNQYKDSLNHYRTNVKQRANLIQNWYISLVPLFKLYSSGLDTQESVDDDVDDATEIPVLDVPDKVPKLSTKESQKNLVGTFKEMTLQVQNSFEVLLSNATTASTTTPSTKALQELKGSLQDLSLVSRQELYFVNSLKSDIRALKGIFLSTTNFPLGTVSSTLK